MMTIPQAFEAFVSSLELPMSKRDDAIRQHTYLREQLQDHLPLDKSLLSGSYARHTAIQPLNDIDLFLVLRPTEEYHQGLPPSALLRKVQDVLEKIYDGKTALVQSRSVNIEFSGAGIAFDLVPAFSAGSDVYVIPDRETNEWIHTNPEVHKRLSTEANDRAGQKLKPLLKALKRSNFEHRDNDGRKPARSFHLEVLTWSALTREPKGYFEGLLILLEGLEPRICRPCPDPAGLGPDIQPSPERCEKAREWLAEMLKLARAAEQHMADGRIAAAHAELRDLFGSDWPEKGSRERKPGVGPAIITPGGAPDDPRGRFG